MEEELRGRLKDSLNGLSYHQLAKVEAYMATIGGKAKPKSDILAYSGMLKDFDEEVMDDLTVNLRTSFR